MKPKMMQSPKDKSLGSHEVIAKLKWHTRVMNFSRRATETRTTFVAQNPLSELSSSSRIVLGINPFFFCCVKSCFSHSSY